MKCKIGTRTSNGNITIHKYRAKGYSNILCILNEVKAKEKEQEDKANT